MTRSLVAAVALLAAAAAHAGAPLPRHAGATPNERLLICTQALVGKALLWHPSTPDLSRLPCPKSRRSLRKTLKSAGVSLVEKPFWMYLFPADLRSPEAKWWRVEPERLEFHPLITNLGGEEQLSHDELDRSSAQVLQRARLLPAIPPESNRLPLQILFVAHTLQDGTRQVVAVIRSDEETESGRIAFGVIRDGRYTMLWDSPLLNVRDVRVDFADLDGDDRDDIVVRGHLREDPGLMTLTAFDATGHEISRQSRCMPLDVETAGGLSQACPIAGVELQIAATGRQARIVDVGSIANDTWVLYEGRLVPMRPASPRPKGK